MFSRVQGGGRKKKKRKIRKEEKGKEGSQGELRGKKKKREDHSCLQFLERKDKKGWRKIPGRGRVSL